MEWVTSEAVIVYVLNHCGAIIEALRHPQEDQLKQGPAWLVSVVWGRRGTGKGLGTQGLAGKRR